MYKRILVAVDGSTNSLRAATHAAYLASTCTDIIVEILYILDCVRTRSDIIVDVGREDLHIDRLKLLSPIENLFKDKGIPHYLVIKHGQPASTIILYANNSNFDLVIVGSRGLNFFQEMVLGSVSHKVAKRVNAPLLIVK